VSHSSAPDPENAPPSEEEAKLLAQLRANPIFAARFQVLMNRFDEEVAAGMDAHEAEEMVIAELDELGKSIMGQWADNTHAKNLTEAQANDPALVKSGKKTPVVYHLRNPRSERTSAATWEAWLRLSPVPGKNWGRSPRLFDPVEETYLRFWSRA
jgi:hypothetical protein